MADYEIMDEIYFLSTYFERRLQATALLFVLKIKELQTNPTSKVRTM